MLNWDKLPQFLKASKWKMFDGINKASLPHWLPQSEYNLIRTQQVSKSFLFHGKTSDVNLYILYKYFADNWLIFHLPPWSVQPYFIFHKNILKMSL